MAESEKSNISFGSIVATIGAVLIALGIAWLIALNWHEIPGAFKIVLLIFFTIAAYAAGVFLRIYEYPKIGESLLVLGALLYTLSIFLIAQIFNLSITWQGYASLLLLSWVGVILAAYLFTSKGSVAIALVEFFVWIFFQYLSLEKQGSPGAMGILVVIYLIIAVLLYGLTQFHKSINHAFVEVYRYWTAVYVLFLAYLLSFQTILPRLWPRGFELSLGTFFFLVVIGLAACIAAIVGVYQAVSKGKLTGKEAVGFLTLLFFYVILIGATSLVSGPEVRWYGGGGLSAGLFFFWILYNILFIFVILSVIGYGTRYQSSDLVNLSIAFFGLDILTRYIGFIQDLGGQVGFAVMSIIGGVILIFGGWFIEKWRRRLITLTEKKTNEYTIY